MNLKITKNVKEANLVTHGSSFHPDDVFSTMFMSKIIENPVVCRTNNPEEANENAIVYDIGFGKFDHHGKDAKRRIKPDIPYCSFGLLWQEYGHEFLKRIKSKDRDKLFNAIDKKLVMQIDAIDNGIFPEIKAQFSISDIDKVVSNFNLTWNEEGDNDNNFLEAVSFAEKIFDRYIIKENAQIDASIIVNESIPKSQNGILILDQYLPYEEALWSSTLEQAKDIKVIILPSKRGGYSIKPRTINEHSRDLCCNFNKEYWGLHGEELQNISGIKSARFVHLSGFLGCTETLEDAILLAENAIKNKE